MSEERFDRIEIRLDRLERGQEALRVEVGGLRADQESLRAEVGDLRAGQESLRAGQESLHAELGDLRRYMGVLHEEVLDRIQTLAFDPAPLRREFRAGDAVLREEFNRRIEPLETAMRHKRRR